MYLACFAVTSLGTPTLWEVSSCVVSYLSYQLSQDYWTKYQNDQSYISNNATKYGFWLDTFFLMTSTPLRLHTPSIYFTLAVKYICSLLFLLLNIDFHDWWSVI